MTDGGWGYLSGAGVAKPYYLWYKTNIGVAKPYYLLYKT